MLFFLFFYFVSVDSTGYVCVFDFVTHRSNHIRGCREEGEKRGDFFVTVSGEFRVFGRYFQIEKCNEMCKWCFQFV